MAARAQIGGFERNHRTSVIRQRFCSWTWRPGGLRDPFGRERPLTPSSIFRVCKCLQGGLRSIGRNFARYFELDGICFFADRFELERRSVWPTVEMGLKDLTYSSIIGPIIVWFYSACDAVRSVGRAKVSIRDRHLRRCCDFRGALESVLGSLCHL